MIHDLTLQEGGAPVIKELQPKEVEIAAESGHWYESATGKQVELPKGTRIQKIIDAGCVPGVTSIQKMAYKYGLERYRLKKAVLAAKKRVEEQPLYDDECLFEDVMYDLSQEGQEITGDGSSLHKAIEQNFRGEKYDSRWTTHICALRHELIRNGIDTTTGKSEHTFATNRYGGKIDWHNDEWLLDFKSKQGSLYIDGKLQKLSYPEHWQQLAAYNSGVSVPACLIGNRHLANVFVGIKDAAVKLVEISVKQVEQGLCEFESLCDFWWYRNDKKQYE